jgi:phosphate transport system protein
MARDRYHDRLATLRTDVVLFGELVVERYESAVAAAEAGDLRAADRIVNGDDEINRRYLELEGDCIDLIARNQPVAGDLRLITASFKILTDLERIADLATNLAERTEYGSGIHPAVDLGSLGLAAGEMVAAAVDAYENDDPAACRAVAADDDTLDSDCEATTERIIRELLAERAGDDDERARTADTTTRGLLTVRDIERVGDHAVNIAARTLYMLDSDDELLY